MLWVAGNVYHLLSGKLRDLDLVVAVGRSKGKNIEQRIKEINDVANLAQSIASRVKSELGTTGEETVEITLLERMGNEAAFPSGAHRSSDLLNIIRSKSNKLDGIRTEMLAMK